jgi:hypothetical protein
MTNDLRSALTEGDTDTPAGIDVAAVRARADRIRRRRSVLAVAAAAAVTAVAIAVPVGLLRAERTSPVAPAPAGLACPDSVPDRPANTGPGLAGALVPFAAREGLLCSYLSGPGRPSGLTGVVRLTAAEVGDVLARLERRPVAGATLACTQELGSPFVLQVGGAGRAVTLRLEPYGCARVSNGVRELAAGPDQGLVRGLGERAAKSTACPGKVDVPPKLRIVVAGPGRLLPTDTRRLLVCRYDVSGARVRPAEGRWNVVLAGADAARVVTQLNAAPAFRPGVTGCTGDAGPLLQLFAVTGDGVAPADADGGRCGIVDNGERQVMAKRLVRKLADSG